MFELINNSGYAEDSYTMGIFSTREKAEEYRDAFIANEAEKSTRKRGYADDLYFTIRKIEVDPVYVHVDYMAQDMGAYKNQFDYAFRNGDAAYILQLRKEWESDYGATRGLSGTNCRVSLSLTIPDWRIGKRNCSGFSRMTTTRMRESNRANQ
jgi:hypothetical protein